MQEATVAAAHRKLMGRRGEIRGLEAHGRSDQFEGRFGRMFRTLPPAQFDAGVLHDLAGAMTAEFEATPTPETEADDEENSGISAGYTYLGQFIDHDLTFDPVSSLQRQNDPAALVDFRTPRFDLDCVYGRGPSDQAYLYRADGLKMLQGDPLTGNSKTQRRAACHGIHRRPVSLLAPFSATRATMRTSSSANCRPPCCASTIAWSTCWARQFRRSAENGALPLPVGGAARFFADDCRAGHAEEYFRHS